MNHIATETYLDGSRTRDLDARQLAAFAALKEQATKLNAAVTRAVDAGLIVEVTRASRHHSPECAWGDQITPRVTKPTL